MKNRFFHFGDSGGYSCYPDLGFNTFNKGRWKWHDDNIGSSEAVKDKLFKGSQELWGHWYFRRWRPTQDGFSTILDIPAPGKYLLVIKEDLRGYPKELVIIDARDPANATWHKLIRP